MVWDSILENPQRLNLRENGAAAAKTAAGGSKGVPVTQPDQERWVCPESSQDLSVSKPEREKIR